MAKHRIRRWLQFGVLDLLIVMTVVAILAVLWRPVQARTNRAAPYIFGLWRFHDSSRIYCLAFLPDGCFFLFGPSVAAADFRWTMTPLGERQDAFVLKLGPQQLFMQRDMIIRSQWGSGVIEVLNEDGSVQSRLELMVLLDGPMADSMPDGIWQGHYVDTQEALVLRYNRGELIDWRHDGNCMLSQLVTARMARGLPGLPNATLPIKVAPMRNQQD